MLTRVFRFTGDPKGRIDFRIAYEAFRSRDPQKAKAERKKLAEIQRVLERISDPTGDLPEDAEIDVRMRKLHEKGGEVKLSQSAFVELEQCVEECPFMAGLSLQVEEFKDRWSAAEKVEADGDEAKPTQLRRRG